MLVQISVINLPLWILAWFFLIFGILSLIVLLVYSKYGRELSMKFSIINILITSSLLAFSIHFFLITLGL